MGRQFVLPVVAAGLVFALSIAEPSFADEPLDGDSVLSGWFAQDEDGANGAAVGGQYTRPGTDSRPVDGHSPDPGQVAEGIGFGGTTEPTRPAAPPRDICSPTNPTDCFFTGAEPTPPAGEPAVTLRDVATFQPAPHEHTAEPAGWAVVDLPANAVAEAGTVTRSGTLFARPVQVRFHPVGYRWMYSDGATVGSAGPGATWAELGQREFTATPTSHVYRSKGEHTARLDVTYVAEYRFDGSAWRWIDGTLVVQGTPQPVLVGDFDTVLVTGPCTTHPGSPGCG